MMRWSEIPKKRRKALLRQVLCIVVVLGSGVATSAGLFHMDDPMEQGLYSGLCLGAGITMFLMTWAWILEEGLMQRYPMLRKKRGEYLEMRKAVEEEDYGTEAENNEN